MTRKEWWALSPKEQTERLKSMTAKEQLHSLELGDGRCSGFCEVEDDEGGWCWDHKEVLEVLEKAFSEERERCAKIAETWEPEMPPSFNSLSLTAAMDQFDAKLRPIQIKAAKDVAAKIREAR